MARITNSPAALRAELARAGLNPRVVLVEQQPAN
jgi:hypothetical protein